MTDVVTEDYIELTDDEFVEYVDTVLAEQFTKPGTANVSPGDKAKLKGILAKYAKAAHPFGSCKRDQISNGLSEEHANRRCAVLKDIIKGTTKWRGKEKKMEDGTEVEVYTLDVPDEWTGEFVRELAQSPESFFSSFTSAIKQASAQMGGDGKLPNFEDPRTFAYYLERLSSAARSILSITRDRDSMNSYLEDDPQASVELAEKCKPGDTVSFTEDGKTLSGVVSSVSGDSVTVKVGDKTYTKPYSAITKKGGGSKEKGKSDAKPFGYKAADDPEGEYDVFIMPYLEDAPQEVELEGNKARYWKQILPLGKRIKYRDGNYLKTDRDFLKKLADNINANRWPAFFKLQGDGDGHSPNALNTAGVIVGARVSKRGLDVKIEPRTDEGKKHLASFPEYPVSAFYAENYIDGGTGEKVGPRLFHVAAVERPYINEMSPAEIAAAEEEAGDRAHVVDLSGEQYSELDQARKEAQVVTDTATQQQEGGEGVTEQQQTDDNQVVLSQEAFDDMQRRLEAAENRAQTSEEIARAEAFNRLSDRTLSYLRTTYPEADEAQVRAAHALIVLAHPETGERAVSLSDQGEVQLADKENDPRAGYVETLLNGCNSAPRLGENGVDAAQGGSSAYQGAKERARQRAKDEDIDYKVALSEEVNKLGTSATLGEVQS